LKIERRDHLEDVIKIGLKNGVSYELQLFVSGQGPVTGCCKYGNDSLVFIMGGLFLD
jgi:hypothetical protein